MHDSASDVSDILQRAMHKQVRNMHTDTAGAGQGHSPGRATCKIGPVALEKLHPILKGQITQAPLVIKPVEGIHPRRQQKLNWSTCIAA